MSAPTTEEVREAREAARARGDWIEAVPLERYALPLAEHRDALAAEVARLKAQLASTDESIRAMRAKNDHREGGHGCGCGGY